MAFLYNLGTPVKLTQSGESGTIIGRAEFTNSDEQYFVRYVDGNGCLIQKWWPHDAIAEIEQIPL